ncbi:PepSY domain-containing protein [uncultured Lactobacillus sp.]|uniref:PepSY domain-containing protein n=1 Tax=uncultured Lactobacillus sp. TaxID=153152 RepID=UPI0028048A82|nr:PepSY domain-containing protein [uncultured Lactobacillus sp.]
MKKFFSIILSVGIGIILGVGITKLYFTHTETKTSNVVVHVGDFLNRTEQISYSSEKLPTIHTSQEDAIEKFKSLYSSAEIKSISLVLDHDVYVYNIVGYDDRKDCMIQIDATNNKIVGQSTQVLDYDYEKDSSLNLKRTISRKSATSLALKEVPGATPLSWELEDVDDQAIWKIDLAENGHKRIVKINAETKDIM